MSNDKAAAARKDKKEKTKVLPIGIDKEETRYRILSELIKAEDHYVRKIHSARHSIAHEILSDSSAIIGALTTFQFAYIKSLLAVTPIVGMLVWEKMQARNDLKRLHRVAELFRKTRDPRYFHVLGLELEGIPRTEDLSYQQKLKVEKDIKAILGEPVSFGDSLKNLREEQKEDDSARMDSQTGFSARARTGLRKLFKAARGAGSFLWGSVVELKNLKTLPKNYLKTSFILADQCKDVVYLPLRRQFQKAAAPVQGWLARKDKDALSADVTVARVKSSQTARFAADPLALKREIDRINKSLRRVATQSAVNGVAFVCQSAFVVNQSLLTKNLVLQDEWAAALGVALPSVLALSPLNYFAKNHIDKNSQLKSKRADMAKRLNQHTHTLHAVEQVKRMIGEIQEEKNEGTHLKMAKELVGMFGDDFNPKWFEKDQRKKLENLFNLVAQHKEDLQKDSEAPADNSEPAREQASAGQKKDEPKNSP
jgi:hypothetical protein